MKDTTPPRFGSYYEDGVHDGYRAVETEAGPAMPAHAVGGDEYMRGWEEGLRQGRSDYWDDKEEQSWLDWQAGL